MACKEVQLLCNDTRRAMDVGSGVGRGGWFGGMALGCKQGSH